MLFLLFVHSVVVRAAASDQNTSPSSCDNINDCRTLWDIVSSCLSTIFLCTWVAIHPNIPGPVDNRRTSFGTRCLHLLSCLVREKLPLFLCAVLVPEYTLAWALRQKFMVKTILKENGKVVSFCDCPFTNDFEADLPLTPIHGFFMIMGGFHLFGPSNNTDNATEKPATSLEVPVLQVSEYSDIMQRATTPIYPLTHQDITSMIRKKQIILPTEEEIKDKGKNDHLAKILVVVQTLWFVMQCIARQIQHLPTTGLEIITIAYAFICLAIYIVWWDKPYGVEYPVRVLQKPETPEKAEDGHYNWLYKALLFTIGGEDEWSDLHHRKGVPIFYSGTYLTAWCNI